MTRRPIDEKLMTDFLLGNLPEEEVEWLDEISLSDDDFANRLQAVENDLVDSYVRGELTATDLKQFKTNYLRSSKRQEKVAFAEALQKQLNKSSYKKRPVEFLAAPRSSLSWLFATAAVVILGLSGYLIFENIRLQNQLRRIQVEKESFREREQQLQKQIAQLKHQSEGTKSDEVKLLAFVLMPQTRGINKIPVLNIPVGTDYIALTLKLDTNDFSAYQAGLRNPVTDQITWKSENLEADKTGNSVQVKIPANLLNPQNYLLELSGISSSGAAEIVNSYPFRIATK